MGFRHTAAWAPKIIRNFACKESRNQCCTKVMPNGIPSLASRVSCPVMAGKDIVCWKRTVKKNAMWVSLSRTSKWIVQYCAMEVYSLLLGQVGDINYMPKNVEMILPTTTDLRERNHLVLTRATIGITERQVDPSGWLRITLPTWIHIAPQRGLLYIQSCYWRFHVWCLTPQCCRQRPIVVGRVSVWFGETWILPHDLDMILTLSKLGG